MANTDLKDQERHSQLRIVIDAVRETLAPNDLDAALYAVITGVRKLLGEDASAAITLVDETGQIDPDTYRVVGPLAEIMGSEKPRAKDGINAWVAEHNTPVFEEDVSVQEATDHPIIRKDRVAAGSYACLPLRDNQNVIGALFVMFRSPFHFDDEIKVSLNSFGSLAARVVELTRLREESSRQKNLQVQTAQQISKKLVETWQELDPVGTLDKTLSDILRQVDEDVLSDLAISAIVYIYEEGEGFYSGVAHGPLQEYMIGYPPRTGGTGEYTIKTKQPLFVSDVATMPPEIPPLSQQAIEQGVKAFANLPLLIGEEGRETLVGVLLINLQQPYDFDEDRQAVLRLFANQAAIALQNTRVQRRRLREQEALHRISESAVGGKPDDVGDVIARQVVELTRSAYATVCYADLSRAQLELKGSYAVDPTWQEHDRLLPIDDHSINGYVAQTKQPYYAADLDRDRYYTGLYENLKAAFCVPLLVREELIGTLYVVSEKEHGISAADQEFIKRLAPHAALAIRNAELYSLEQRRNRDLDTLNQSALKLSKVLDDEQVYQAILDAVIETLDCDYCTIFLAEINNRLIARAAGGRLFTRLPEIEFTPGEGLAGWVYQQDQSLIVNNTATDPRYKPGPSEDKINPRSIILAPMKRGKQLIGVITATFAHTNSFNEKDLRLLETLTLHVGTVLQNIEFFNDFEVLHRVANDLAQQPALEQIYHMAVQSAHETLHCRHSTVFILDKKLGDLVPMARLNADEDVSKVRHFKAGEGVAGLVLQTGQSVMVNDAARDEHFIEGRLEPRSSPRSIMVAPIKIENDVIGVLSADKDETDGFTEHNLEVLELLALDVGIAINARRQQDIRQTIADFQSAISDILPVQQQLDQIHDKMSGLMDTRNMYIALYDEQTDMVEFPLAYEGGQRVPNEAKQVDGSPYARRVRRDKGLTEWVLQQKQPLLIDKNYDAWIEARPEIEYYTIGAKCWLGAPMLHRNRAIGIIALRNYEQEGVFDETHRDLLMTIAGQAAVALDNARQYDVINNQLQRRIAELEAVSHFQHQISDLGPVEEELQATYDIAADAMKDLMDTREMLIALYDEATGIIEFPLVYRSGKPVPDEEKVKGSPYGRRSLGERRGLTEWVIQQKQPLLIKKDFEREAKAKNIDAFPIETKCWLGVPMLFREKVIGIISLRSFEREAVFDEGHRDLLWTIAGQAAIALDNARQYDLINNQLARRIAELEAVTEFQKRISDIRTVEEELQGIYNQAAEVMAGIMDTRNMYIALFDDDKETIEFPLVYRDGHPVSGADKGIDWNPRRVGDQHGLTEWVIHHKQPLLIEHDIDEWAAIQPDVQDYHSGIKCWLSAPMVIRDKLVGVIGLMNFEEERVFDENHRALLTMIASQAAIALDNAGQYDLINSINSELQRRFEELRAVSKFQRRISDIGTIEKGLQAIYDHAAAVMAGIMDTRNMYIALFDEETEMIEFPLAYKDGVLVSEKEKAKKGSAFGQRQRGDRKGLTDWVIRHKRPLLVQKAFDIWVEQQEDIEAFPIGTQCWLGAPMMLRDIVIGVIGLQNFEQEGVFDENHRNLLVTIAGQAAVALDNARQYDLINNQLRRRISELEAVRQFQQQISSVSTVEQELQEIYDRAAEAMSGLMDTRNMYIALYDEKMEMIEFPLAYDKGRRVLDEEKVQETTWRSRRFGERKGLTEWVIRHKEALLIERGFDIWVKKQEDVEAFAIGTKCWLGAPMLLRDKVIGVIGLQNFEQEGVFDENHRDLLVTIASQAAVALDNARQYDVINNQLQRRLKELEAVSRFQQEISSLGLM